MMEFRLAIVIGLTQVLYTVLCGSIIINGSQLRSLRCLGMNSTKENCRVLGAAEATPDWLIDIYRNQKKIVQDALGTGDLNMLKEHDLATLHPDLLLLLPSSELALIDGDKLAYLLDQWSDDKAFVKHIASAALLSDNVNTFLKKIGTTVLGREALETIGEDLTLQQNLKMLGPLLPHLPTYQIYNITNEKRLKVLVFLKLYLNNEDYKWSEKRPVTHRIWAKLLMDAEFPKPLNQWNNLDIQTIGEILIGAKASELSNIDGRNMIDKAQLFHLKFNSLQVRTLFTKVYNDMDFTSLDFRDLKPILNRLLPTQLQRFSDIMTNFKSLQISPPIKSVATSKQIMEYLLREGRHKIPQRTDRDYILQIGHMVHSLSLSALSAYMDEPLSLDQLLTLQSKYLTPSQVYYLLGGGRVLNVSNDRFEDTNVFLHALSTARLPMKLTKHQVIHLCQHLPTDNLPRLIKFLNSSLTTIGSTEVIKKLFENPDGLKVLDVLPTRLIMNEFEDRMDFMMKLIKLRSSWPAFPKKMASSLYHGLYQENSFNSTQTELNVGIFMNGFNCQDILKLHTSNFILAISTYRRLIQRSNQEFPKDLQHCSAKKLAEYLKLKSIFRQQYLHDTLDNLLSPVEIQAVGGWVLSSLPVEEIKASSWLKDIVAQIGSLSATEILAAAPLGKMRDIVYNYFALQQPFKNVNIKQLSVLGNLTMILEEHIIKEIDVESFKVLLEGNYFDTRICSTLSQRNAWMNLLIKAFGPTKNWSGEEILILGNFLIALSEEKIQEIPDDAWIQVADLLEFGFLKEVQWYKKNTFLEVCQEILMPSETISYLSSVKTVIKYHLSAAKYQLMTVKQLKQFRLNQENNRSEIDSIYSEPTSTEKNIVKFNSSELSGENDLSSTIHPLHFELNGYFNFTSDDQMNQTDHELQRNNSSTSKDIAHFSEFNVLNDTRLNSFTNKTDLDEINVMAVERSDDSSSFLTSESDEDSGTSEDGKFDEYTFEDLNKEESVEITSQYDSDLLLSHPSQSTFTKLEDRVESFADNSGNQNAEPIEQIYNEDVSPPMKHELVTDIPKSNDRSSNDDQGEIALDFISALTEIEKETRMWNQVEKHQDSDEILQPVINQEKTIIQTLKIPVEKATPAKVKLQDFFQSNKQDTKVYRDLSEALNDEIPPESHQTSQELDIDDILFPPMNKDSAISKNVEKRSEANMKGSCEAMRTVGEMVEIILTENMIVEMSDEELFDCVEFFSKMKLPGSIKKIIWSRINMIDLHLKGALVSEAAERDLFQTFFISSQPWALETIFSLTNFNSNPYVATYMLDDEFEYRETLSIEEVVSLGSALCKLYNTRYILSPSMLLRASVVLGSVLPCNHTCLNFMADIALKQGAFGPTTQWNSFDLADLGVIAAGLNIQSWKEMLEVNPEVLYGLQTNAAECLEISYIQAIPLIHIAKIPYLTRKAIDERLKSSASLLPQQQAYSDHDEVSLMDKSTESSNSSTYSFHQILKYFLIFYYCFNYYIESS